MADKAARLNALRDGIFQVSMSLYNEYCKYLEAPAASQCVVKDLLENAEKFNNGTIANTSKEESVAEFLKAKISDMQSEYTSTSDEHMRWTLAKDIETIEAVLGILNNK